MPRKLIAFVIFASFVSLVFVNRSYAQVEDDGIELIDVSINGQSVPQPEVTKPAKPLQNRMEMTQRKEGVKERIESARQNQARIKEGIKNRASSSATKKIQKLSASKKNVCESRKSNINKRLINSQNVAKRIHSGHYAIFQKVDSFYKNKLLSAGYELENYDQLILEINTNKETVDVLQKSIKENTSGFDCNSDDPSGQISIVREDFKSLIEANKSYKESIKNYVKAVLELAKSAKENTISVSPSLNKEGEE